MYFCTISAKCWNTRPTVFKIVIKHFDFGANVLLLIVQNFLFGWQWRGTVGMEVRGRWVIALYGCESVAWQKLAKCVNFMQENPLHLQWGVSKQLPPCRVDVPGAEATDMVETYTCTLSLFKTRISTWGKSKGKGGRPARGRVPRRTCRRSNYCGFAEVLGFSRAEL